MKARTWSLAAAAVALLAGGYAWARLGEQGDRARLGAGYVARVVCACRYVGNRDLASCKTDLEPGTEIVRMSDDPAAKRVTAYVPLIASRSASFAPGYGCTFDD